MIKTAIKDIANIITLVIMLKTMFNIISIQKSLYSYNVSSYFKSTHGNHFTFQSGTALTTTNMANFTQISLNSLRC